MPRPKSIETDELLSLLHEYSMGISGVTITIPRFGDFVRSKGHNIKNHTLRRNAALKAALTRINQETDSLILKDLVTYRKLDVEAFLAQHRTLPDLREAIRIRDSYYESIAARGASAIRKNKELLTQIEELTKKCSELDRQLSEVTAALSQKSVAIDGLREILDSYVYPSVANTLMAEMGLAEVVNEIVDKEVVDSKTLLPDTNISNFDSINKLMEGFE
ncbi:MAG: hypothetical protein Q4B15_06195 [Lachnospiraceae bacterium]|nr:hypothetical protein [Lachnospiraceae bacterium]